MYPMYRYVQDFQLDPDDVQGIQYLYGEQLRRSRARRGSRGAGPAPSLTPSPVLAQVMALAPSPPPLRPCLPRSPSPCPQRPAAPPPPRRRKRRRSPRPSPSLWTPAGTPAWRRTLTLSRRSTGSCTSSRMGEQQHPVPPALASAGVTRGCGGTRSCGRGVGGHGAVPG